MSNREEQAQEVEALRSIYCKAGEMRDIQDETIWRIWIELDTMPGPEGSNSKTCSGVGNVQFTLPCDYPQVSLPLIDVKCLTLDKKVVETIAKTLTQRARDLQGERMLLDLACLAKELVEEKLSDSTNSTRTDESEGDKHNSLQDKIKTMDDNSLQVQTQEISSSGRFPCDQSSPDKSKPSPTAQKSDASSVSTVTMLLHLDHMRSKSSYSKMIKKWAGELSLTGRLIFCHKMILILLQGDMRNVKEYVVRNRTTNVDVDSRGRSCKERMLSVLCEAAFLQGQEVGEFSVVDFTSEELSSFFSQHSMEEMYTDHVKPLLTRSTGGSRKT